MFICYIIHGYLIVFLFGALTSIAIGNILAHVFCWTYVDFSVVCITYEGNRYIIGYGPS